MRVSKIIVAASMGLVTGLTVSLLSAPCSGAETLQYIMNALKEVKKKLFRESVTTQNVTGTLEERRERILQKITSSKTDEVSFVSGSKY